MTLMDQQCGFTLMLFRTDAAPNWVDDLSMLSFRVSLSGCELEKAKRKSEEERMSLVTTAPGGFMYQWLLRLSQTWLRDTSHTHSRLSVRSRCAAADVSLSLREQRDTCFRSVLHKTSKRQLGKCAEISTMTQLIWSGEAVKVWFTL